jgi:hypothetical protein
MRIRSKPYFLTLLVSIMLEQDRMTLDYHAALKDKFCGAHF